jgi:hypothetical protein
MFPFLHKKQPAPQPTSTLASLLSRDMAWRLLGNANELLTYAQLENEREQLSDWTMIEAGLEHLRDHFENHLQDIK